MARRYILVLILLIYSFTAGAQLNYDDEDYINRPIAYQFINFYVRVYPSLVANPDVNLLIKRYDSIKSIKGIDSAEMRRNLRTS